MAGDLKARQGHPPPSEIVAIRLPIRVENPLNGSHQHWAVKARARKLLRTAVGLASAIPLTPLRGRALSVRITRVSPKAFDYDGLVAACKPVVDGIADALGLDDDRTLWVEYGWRRGEPKEHALELEVSE